MITSTPIPDDHDDRVVVSTATLVALDLAVDTFIHIPLEASILPGIGQQVRIGNLAVDERGARSLGLALLNFADSLDPERPETATLYATSPTFGGAILADGSTPLIPDPDDPRRGLSHDEAVIRGVFPPSNAS